MADITFSTRTVGTIRPYLASHGYRLGTYDASTCASTALIVQGNIVQFDTTSSATHRVIRASTAAAGVTLSTNMVGVAMSADTSDGSTTGLGEGKRPITIALFVPGQSFLFPTKIAGTASTLVNTQLALGWDSTNNFHYLNANSTAGDMRFWVTQVINAGDSNGYVVAKPHSTAVAPAIWPR